MIKKFLLLDTIGNGIYIIDIELKQKVVVSDLKLFYEGQSKSTNYLINSEKKKELKKYLMINIKFYIEK